MKLSSWIILLALVCGEAYSQNGNGGSKREFILPVFPNETNTLAGTMGELRYSHFHTGIDVRTRGRIGLPIVAAADGFINRISVSPGGYGNALYIQHPDGKITVYAHLNNFNEEISQFVRTEQYKRQRFQINLFPAKDQFKVKQGDLIAYSGNSGSSSGPHLHFDLRDENHNLLNPLEYGLHEVVDEIPPVARRIALSSLDINSRVNGEFGRFEFSLVKKGEHYISMDTLHALGPIGIEIYSYDRQNFTFFRTGIPFVKVTVNNKEIFRKDLKEFSFSDQSEIDVLTNYQKKRTTGRSFMKLYIDDGNELRFLKSINKGRLKIQEGQLYEVHIDLIDAYGNNSAIKFFIKGKNPLAPKPASSKPSTLSYSVSENTLVIKANKDSLFNNQLKYFAAGQEYNISPNYIASNGNAVFLLDLRKKLPDSISTVNSKKYFNFRTMVPPAIPYDFYGQSMDLKFSQSSLFDTLYLETTYEKSDEGLEIFGFHNTSEPLNGSVKVTLKPRAVYPSKTDVYTINSRGDLGYVGGTWEGSIISFNSGGFGKFTLATDTIPPIIRPIVISQNDLRFIIDDKMSGIDEYKVFVDNRWLLMNYDPKRKLIWSEKLNPEMVFNGDIILMVSDRAGNERTYQTKSSTK